MGTSVSCDGSYDDGYRQCSCFWGTGPGSMILLLEKYIQFDGLRVLDAGCGEGKNALYLAKAGASVIAIDKSKLAIANALASAAHPNVEYRAVDIRDVELGADHYDVILIYGLTHCLADAEEASTIVQNLKAVTKPGGWHAFCAFNSRSQDLSAHPGFNPLLMHHESLLSMYGDWICLHLSDRDLVEIRPHNQIEHSHSLTRILARKPSR